MPFSASIRRISWQLATPHGATNMKLSCLWEVKDVTGFNGSETVLPPTSTAVRKRENGSSKFFSTGNTLEIHLYLQMLAFPPSFFPLNIPLPFFNPHISLGKSSEHSHLSHPSNHPPCPTRNAVGISAEKSSGTIHATPWARRPQPKLSDQMVRYRPRPGGFFQRGVGPNKYPLRCMWG